MGEYGSGDEDEFLLLGIVNRHAGHIIWQQVGGALESFKVDGKRGGQCSRQHRLAGSRHVFEQNVPFAEDGHHQIFQNIAFADDHALDVV